MTSPDGAEGVELLLEPLGFEPAKVYYEALYDAGIPCAHFESDDVDAEAARLKEKGVSLRGEPQVMGDAKVVIFDDTCGNLLCMVEKLG